LAANLDLLVKRGVTAVREIAASPARWAGASLSPRQLRYGLWGFPLAHTLPADGSVSGLQRRLLTGRQAAEAGRGGCVLHVGIEMGGLVAGDRGAWRAMEKGLRHLARLRAEEGVRVECLRTVAARLSAVPIAAPQQSILRRAA
jgi:hypothetical protein